MIFYHYCSLKTFLSIINKRKLWFADLTKSNDINEFKYITQLYKVYLDKEKNSSKKFTKEIEKSMSIINEVFAAYSIYGVCLTSENASKEMWQKYGDNYKGVCFGINVDEEIIKKGTLPNRIVDSMGEILQCGYVKYYNSYDDLKTIFDELFKEDKLAINHIKDLLSLAPLIKSASWSSEKEFRFVFVDYNNKVTEEYTKLKKLGSKILLPTSFCDEETNKKFRYYDFDLNLNCLSEIIVGYDCPKSIDELKEELKNSIDLKNTKIYKSNCQ